MYHIVSWISQHWNIGSATLSDDHLRLTGVPLVSPFELLASHRGVHHYEALEMPLKRHTLHPHGIWSNLKAQAAPRS